MDLGRNLNLAQRAKYKIQFLGHDWPGFNRNRAKKFQIYQKTQIVKYFYEGTVRFILKKILSVVNTFTAFLYLAPL